MSIILGIDEVGRGPLAGPLVVGAVILPAEKPEWILELRDSKKLSPRRREKLAEKILSGGSTVGLGWVTPVEIDELGMSKALKLAARRAVKEIQSKKRKFTEIIIDGNLNFFTGTALEKYTTTLIKGDDKIKEISAASIVAKVVRDKYMTEIAAEYPEYGFEKHMGYGTTKHRQAILKIGVCPEHRRSFEPCKSLVGFSRGGVALKNTTATGSRAEDVVADFLRAKGHEIVTQNFKTYRCEIDVISVYGGKIYFTEVKYRKNDERGGGLAAITKTKQEQMRYAAEVFLKYQPQFRKYDPLLAAAAVKGLDFEIVDWFALD